MKPVSELIQAFCIYYFPFHVESLAFYDDKRKAYQSIFLFSILLLI
jgi:hypothetical protein